MRTEQNFRLLNYVNVLFTIYLSSDTSITAKNKSKTRMNIYYWCLTAHLKLTVFDFKKKKKKKLF